MQMIIMEKKPIKTAYNYLSTNTNEKDICMVGFVLKNTLSDNGGVTRGVCQAVNNKIVDIVETHNIEHIGSKAIAEGKEIDLDSVVSMNMWGLYPEIFTILDKGFHEFLENLDPKELKAEYLLPTIIGDLLAKKEIKVEVLKSNDEWFGVTYKEDVKNNIHLLVKKGLYSKII